MYLQQGFDKKKINGLSTIYYGKVVEGSLMIRIMEVLWLTFFTLKKGIF